MKAIIKFAIDIDKWVIDIETDNKEVFPVGKMINKDIELFEISKWDTKKQAEEWVKFKGLVLD